MLCPTATAKSGSSWLDRLRSSKGFPAADNLHIDHFLKERQSSNSECKRRPPTQNGVKDEEEWVGVMTNVLSELFIMGGSDNVSGKKSLRKQPNPKFCVISTPHVVGDHQGKSVRKDENAQDQVEVLPNWDSNSNGAETNDVGELKEKEKEKEKEVLFGYSRSEVTVIDTSSSVWKLDKLVIRRKNVWKVRDKRGKSSNTAVRNKRKQAAADAHIVVFKKAKVSREEDDRQDFALPSTSSHNYQDDKKEDCKEKSDDLNQVPDKRSRLARKSRKGDSSAILVKGISKSKNSGTRHPKNGLKGQSKAIQGLI
ncbi:hypothetical protein CFOL_v3_16741 [Cephalotus follicularis]|uniref:Uncharacterized protein n=1 Tax=Cephalotus follicularis TaxID=3775 RepID=A0A1Q3BZ04_CEPFO|nr:hypothetical protein CFOL_v3_16741 [Cephalotus follicularis]